MYKYWKIGTGAYTYLIKFMNLKNDSNLELGDKISLFENDNLYLILRGDDKIHEFYSKSTARQYFDAWEAMGFIKWIHGSQYLITTRFKDENLLRSFSAISILEPSQNKRAKKYQQTLIINILVAANIINSYDIAEKDYKKGLEPLNIEIVRESISKYEKKMVEDKNYLGKVKEYYDKKF